MYTSFRRAIAATYHTQKPSACLVTSQEFCRSKPPSPPITPSSVWLAVGLPMLSSPPTHHKAKRIIQNVAVIDGPVRSRSRQQIPQLFPIMMHPTCVLHPLETNVCAPMGSPCGDGSDAPCTGAAVSGCGSGTGSGAAAAPAPLLPWRPAAAAASLSTRAAVFCRPPVCGTPAGGPAAPACGSSVMCSLQRSAVWLE